LPVEPDDRLIITLRSIAEVELLVAPRVVLAADDLRPLPHQQTRHREKTATWVGQFTLRPYDLMVSRMNLGSSVSALVEDEFRRKTRGGISNDIIRKAVDLLAKDR
jgi:hypothetical protein